MGSSTSTLQRPRSNRILGGVCAGIGRRFGVSPWLVRGLFVLSCLLPGPQILIYAGLWLLIPSD
ncbi:MAG: PspC domain-containing protein [Microbacteriaceae bacterium]|nr:PspC domain-containing protein [Microbacteriaceae bacterium]